MNQKQSIVLVVLTAVTLVVGVTFAAAAAAATPSAFAKKKDRTGDGSTPPGTLRVCKQITGDNRPGLKPSDFPFTVTGNNPSPDQFPGDKDCVKVTIGPGAYTIQERVPVEPNVIPRPPTGDCTATGDNSATGTIKSGQTETCTFTNFCCATGTIASQAKP